MAAQLLIRYGELGLKSAPVRREFERRLTRNLMEQFRAAELSCRVRGDRGHLYLEADDPETALRLVRRVFGVTSVSEVWETTSEVEAIRSTLLALAEPRLRPGSSFAVRARRSGQHAFTSQELARDLGAAVLARWPERHLTVDLGHPDIELGVEVRDQRTYLSFDRRAGPGGLPLGVAGPVVAFVDGVRGALGAYLLMKRGCRLAAVATADGERLATDVLGRFDPNLSVVRAEDRERAEVALGELARTTAADGVALPLSVDEFGAARDKWADRVVFSPTVGLSDEEVDARWREVEALAA